MRGAADMRLPGQGRNAKGDGPPRRAQAAAADRAAYEVQRAREERQGPEVYELSPAGPGLPLVGDEVQENVAELAKVMGKPEGIIRQALSWCDGSLEMAETLLRSMDEAEGEGMPWRDRAVSEQATRYVWPQEEEWCAVHAVNNALAAGKAKPVITRAQMTRGARAAEALDPTGPKHGSDRGDFTAMAVVNALEERGIPYKIKTIPRRGDLEAIEVVDTLLPQHRNGAKRGVILRPTGSAHWVALVRLRSGRVVLLDSKEPGRQYRFHDDTRVLEMLQECDLAIAVGEGAGVEVEGREVEDSGSDGGWRGQVDGRTRWLPVSKRCMCGGHCGNAGRLWSWPRCGVCFNCRVHARMFPSLGRTLWQSERWRSVSPHILRPKWS